MDNCFLLFWVGLITSGAGRKQIWGLGYFLSLSTFCFIWGITAKGPNVQSIIWAGTEADNTGIWLECFYMAHHHITSHILDDFHPEEGLPCPKKGCFWVPIDGDFVSSLIEIILSLHTDKENYCISSPQRGGKKKKTQLGKGNTNHPQGITYVLHTPFQSKWIYSFLLNLAWPFFPVCQSSYRACDYFSFSRPNYSFLNFGDMAAAQVFLVKMIFICPLYFIYFPLWLHSYKSNTQN